MNGLIIIAAAFLLIWLLLIRPQRKRQLEQRRLLSDVSVGDEIVTAGGLYGTVQSVSEDELMLEIAPGTVVRLARRAVAGVFSEEDEADEEDEDVEAEEQPAQLEAPADEAEAGSGTAGGAR